MSKMRWLLIHTSLASVTNGAAAPATGTGGLVSCADSPFCSGPCTTMKEASLINLQVRIGGVSLFENPIVYNYDMFINHLRGAYSLNGGLELGLSSGLLDERKWSAGYGYVFVDLSRYENASQDEISKGLEVIGTNNSLAPVDYTFYVGHEQSFTLHTATGRVTM